MTPKTVRLLDVWRFQFPNTRAYSFFSNVHHSHTCIDYFLLDKRLLPKIQHAPTTAL